MSEIEKYYNGEIYVDFDDEIEELKADIEEYRDSTTWWSNRFNAVERDNRELGKEIGRLHSIIKEVREYIDKFIKANYEDVFNQEQKEYMVKILQMLDKESELC